MDWEKLYKEYEEGINEFYKLEKEITNEMRQRYILSRRENPPFEFPKGDWRRETATDIIIKDWKKKK